MVLMMAHLVLVISKNQGIAKAIHTENEDERAELIKQLEGQM